jgi:hypothetical protein
MTKGLHFLCGAVAILIATGSALSAPLPGPLKGLEPGEWELRERGGDEVHRLCLADLRQLIQIRHLRGNCKRLTVEEGVKHLSVSYDCAGAGGGRTDLRIETSRLIQLRSQGVANGAPFSSMLEGRRIGPCH